MIKQTQKTIGTVRWYNKEKGFGFITPDNYEGDVFLHQSVIQKSTAENISEGDRIAFKVQQRKKGPAAVKVEKLREKSFKDEIAVDQYDVNYNESDKNFTDLNLTSTILRAIGEEGYVEPTPIQSHAIPLVMKGRDVLGCAQTGTGKTAAFALPIIQRLEKNLNNNGNGRRNIRVLVLAPTRELALQISDSFKTYGKYTKLKTTVIYGGVGQNPQVNALRQGVDVVVATPGRLLDLMGQGHVKLQHIEVLIFDEADRMLDMGFIPDIRRIVKQIPKKNRQTLLFSATLSREILRLASDILNNPIEINISPDQPTVEFTEQTAFFVSNRKKQALLEYLLKNSNIERALVFTRTKRTANHVARNLKKHNFNAGTIHGDKSQTARQKALRNFRKGKTRVLVATDVVARGIDVDNISHVIQYDLPDIPKTYVHRIGRTGRMGTEGSALLFCQGNQKDDLKDIEDLIGMDITIIRDHPYRI
ncbi:MAG: DEAD/DEAH box helicase [Promethearchaeota archaeon]|nr:MAG: DEAD/DEAH box helicase [Candidatus Lokiarchaeota archaeon]